MYNIINFVVILLLLYFFIVLILYINMNVESRHGMMEYVLILKFTNVKIPIELL